MFLLPLATETEVMYLLLLTTFGIAITALLVGLLSKKLNKLGQEVVVLKAEISLLQSLNKPKRRGRPRKKVEPKVVHHLGEL